MNQRSIPISDVALVAIAVILLLALLFGWG